MGRSPRSSSPTTSGSTGAAIRTGLTDEEIPEIAKIIAVAEVYDTLTASDTYRTRMSSFEAMRELRRVAGTQLDAGYVEVLASLLAARASSTGTRTPPTSTPSSTWSGGSAKPEPARRRPAQAKVGAAQTGLSSS